MFLNKNKNKNNSLKTVSIKINNSGKDILTPTVLIASDPISINSLETSSSDTLSVNSLETNVSQNLIDIYNVENIGINE
jgi:hypothetical protein